VPFDIFLERRRKCVETPGGKRGRLRSLSRPGTGNSNRRGWVIGGLIEAELERGGLQWRTPKFERQEGTALSSRNRKKFGTLSRAKKNCRAICQKKRPKGRSLRNLSGPKKKCSKQRGHLLLEYSTKPIARAHARERGGRTESRHSPSEITLGPRRGTWALVIQ